MARFDPWRFGRSVIVAGAVLGWLPSQPLAALPDPVRFGVAIELGDAKLARNWLREGLEPDFMADRIGSGLMIAAWEGNIPMMRIFLEAGADIDRTNAHDEQALMLAAWKGHADAVRWLLDHGAAINRRGSLWSALHYAVFAGHAEVARLLIERGADVSARSPNGSTVLMMAAREGREDLARLLVANGADTAATNDAGEDALAWAIRHRNFGIARLVSSAERYARAARAPRDIQAAPRSLPAPARMDEILRAMRIAEAEGRPVDALRSAYLEAFAEMMKDPGSVAGEEPPVPESLEISAVRGRPGRERAHLVYRSGKRPGAVSAARKPSKKRRIEPARSGAEPAAAKTPSSRPQVRAHPG
ncbi:MAG: hypothetical protein Fur0039_01760 [Rhodocyclaceae bacterium]